MIGEFLRRHKPRDRRELPRFDVLPELMQYVALGDLHFPARISVTVAQRGELPVKRVGDIGGKGSIVQAVLASRQLSERLRSPSRAFGCHFSQFGFPGSQVLA